MKQTNQSVNGTSFFGTVIVTSPNTLIAIAKKLGAEYHECNTGEDKSNFDFQFETENGDIFTIYDWKEYRELDLDQSVEFHIGAKNKSVSQQGLSELKSQIRCL